VVVGVGFGVDDGKFALFGCSEEEFLDSLAGSVGEDGLVAVDVVEGEVGDLGIDLIEFVEELFDAFDDFGFNVKLLLGSRLTARFIGGLVGHAGRRAESCWWRAETGRAIWMLK
jgi:hypothetical protein